MILYELDPCSAFEAVLQYRIQIKFITSCLYVANEYVKYYTEYKNNRLSYDQKQIFVSPVFRGVL